MKLSFCNRSFYTKSKLPCVQFLGFIAMLVSMIGYTRATWLQQMEYGEPCKNCPNYINTKRINKSYEIYPETICEFLKDNNLGGVTNDTACPSRWMVVAQVFIFAHIWAAIVIVYVVMLKVDLSKNRVFGLFVRFTQILNFK